MRNEIKFLLATVVVVGIFVLGWRLWPGTQEAAPVVGDEVPAVEVPLPTEQTLRDMLKADADREILDLRMDEETGEATVQFRIRDRVGTESTEYRWYKRKPNGWERMPTVGVPSPKTRRP